MNRSKGVTFFLVVLVFAGLGPAIGGGLFGAVAGLFAGQNSGLSLLASIPGYIFFVLLAILYAYFLGMAHALIAGIIVGAAGIWMRWNNLFVALVAGCVASLIGTLLLQIVREGIFDAAGFHFFIPSSIAAALVCWYVTRGMVRRTWRSA